MEKLELNGLIDAVKKDDLKSFSSIMLSNSDLNLCFGRFPLLSICYLYSSKSILAKYEKLMMPIHNFKIVDEPFSIYKDFKRKAKKSLRLFLDDNIVYPVLMLAVLDNRFEIQVKFQNLFKNEEIVENLHKIYILNNNLDIQVTTEILIIPKKTLKNNQKIVIAIVVAILSLCLLFSGFLILFIKNKVGLGTLDCPIKINSQNQFVKSIDKVGKCFELNCDITISNDFNADLNAVLIGNDHKIYLEKDSGAVFNLVSGELRDCEFVLNKKNFSISESSSLIVGELTGVIENCKISGDLNVVFDSENEDTFFSILVETNKGIIKNCEIKSKINAKNNGQKNAYLSSFAGENSVNATIFNSISYCDITADTVDIAGFVADNYGIVDSSINYGVLSQTSDKEWHPNVAGIAIANYGKILKSKNFASVTAKSTLSDSIESLCVFVGGICCSNYDNVIECENSGKILASSVVSHIFLGGIASQNLYLINENVENSSRVKYSKIEKCKCLNNIDCISDSGQLFIGGVAGYNMAIIDDTCFIGNIDADTQRTSEMKIFPYYSETSGDGFKMTENNNFILCAGGIVGFNVESEIKNCYAIVEFIKNEMGESNYKLFGAIAGNIGIAKSDISYNTGVSYISNNYYVKNESIKYWAYGIYHIDFFFNYGELVYVNDIQGRCVGCNSLDEIPEEVRIDA